MTATEIIVIVRMVKFLVEKLKNNKKISKNTIRPFLEWTINRTTVSNKDFDLILEIIKQIGNKK